MFLCIRVERTEIARCFRFYVFKSLQEALLQFGETLVIVLHLVAEQQIPNLSTLPSAPGTISLPPNGASTSEPNGPGLIDTCGAELDFAVFMIRLHASLLWH